MYDLAITFIVKLLEVLPFGELGRLVRARKTLFQELREHYRTYDSTRKNVLIHVASFGELEQAKPIITALRQDIPNVHIHLTFFSPSGYDNAYHKYTEADIITYLPLDLRPYVRKFLDLSNPNIVVFIRYDVWHTFADELSARGIPAVLACATFDRKKVSNPFTRRLYKKTYNTLVDILAIRESDKQALLELGLDPNRVNIGGDTRYDRVTERKLLAETHPHLLPERIRSKQFSEHRLIVVAGSTWEKDEDLLAELDRSPDFLLIVVPHKTDKSHIAGIKKQFPKSVLYSEIDSFYTEDTIIVDSIGKLFELYHYADIAYVGGGFGTGVHNTLEAAMWGAPVICGPKIERSREIEELVSAKGGFVIKDAKQLQTIMKQLLADQEFRKRAGANAAAYVSNNVGATEKIVKVIGRNIP